MSSNLLSSGEPALFGLIREGNLRAVSLYLEQFPADQALPDYNGTTPLMQAVHSMLEAAEDWQAANNQDQEIEDRVRLLTRVAHYSSYFDETDSEGKSVFHLAACAGCSQGETVSNILAVVSEAVLECLLPEARHEYSNCENCIVARSFWIRDSDRQTALHTAIVHRNSKVASLLLKHMVKNSQRVYRDYDCLVDGERKPLLTLALGHDAPRKLLKLIMLKFPSAASTLSQEKKLPLITAIENVLSPRKLQLLIEAYPAAVKAVTGDGDLPLHLTALYYQQQPAEKQREALHLLVEHHPPALTWSNMHGQWPLHCAMEVSQGEDDDDSNNSNNDDDANNAPPAPLDLAVLQLLSNHQSGAESNEADSGDETTSAQGNALIDPSLAANMVDDSQDTIPPLAIDISTESSMEDVLQLQTNSDHHVGPTDAAAAKFGSCKSSSGESVSALHHVDCYGELPLHLACRRLSTVTRETLQWLIDSNPGALQATNEFGHLPLHLAAATATETTTTITTATNINTNINTDCLRMLVDAHPAALWQPDHEGDVPLQCALGQATVQPALVECLLAEPPADSLAIAAGHHPTENLETGQMPLHFACASGVESSRVLDQLIAYHPTALFHYDKEGHLPIHVAVSHPTTTQSVSTLHKLLFAASRLSNEKESESDRRPRTTTLPSTVTGMPALFVACEACQPTSADEPDTAEETRSLDVIRCLVEHSPELFKVL